MSERRSDGLYPYRPSNGTEGAMFMDQFCLRCAVDTDTCEIIFRSECNYTEDPDYPPEWVSDDDVGLVNPRCTAFEEIGEVGK